MSSDSEGSDDAHFWSRPSSPHETFDNVEGADANGEWQSRHIGYQVDYRGQIIHEVDWTPWKRADGSSTTFENAALTQSDIEEWDEELAEERLVAANASIVVAPGKHRDPLYSLTWNLDQAVEEKLERLAGIEHDPASGSNMDVDDMRAPSPVRPPSPRRRASRTGSSTLVNSSRSTTRDPTSQSHSSRSSTLAGGSRVVSQASRNMSSNMDTPSQPTRSPEPPTGRRTRPKPRRPLQPASSATRPAREVENDVGMQTIPTTRQQSALSSSSETPSTRFSNPATPPIMAARPVQSRPSTTSSQSRSSGTPEGRPSASSRSKGKGKARATPLSILRGQIDEEVERSGAATLDFVNEFDDEQLPLLPEGFRYKEQGYDLGPGVREPSSAFLVHCNCATEGYRCHPRKCDCHRVVNTITNKAGQPIFAYDRENKYRFPNVDDSFEVLECNQFCPCEGDCQNRVAQLPRKIPIEIFRTPNRGWGVRSPQPMKAGTIVGTFSGLLIKREAAENVPDEQRSYCFDLRGATGSSHPEYTVNAWMTGNWSRFLNHSCEPNLDTYHVVWDTVPEENRPYIAFVANTDICAGLELTLDYHPELAHNDGGQAKKKRKKVAEDAMIECDCGSTNCRGWIPG
ncbi:SET domain-containing protein [Schizophyllum commune H4-8]|uniref:SET domain-containing protein n=1 Tax=Schizophyllum commune (strain H4-8 / FGSC 9210) TaxID=578458 RepID=UPI0021609605|nr:SET domain-containing protein [Schizophyllum commune H4-8]KAI5886385.1 SET domain-containing protein [Schizophyllum commune H4-8]